VCPPSLRSILAPRARLCSTFCVKPVTVACKRPLQRGDAYPCAPLSKSDETPTQSGCATANSRFSSWGKQVLLPTLRRSYAGCPSLSNERPDGNGGRRSNRDRVRAVKRRPRLLSAGNDSQVFRLIICDQNRQLYFYVVEICLNYRRRWISCAWLKVLMHKMTGMQRSTRDTAPSSRQVSALVVIVYCSCLSQYILSNRIQPSQYFSCSPGKGEQKEQMLHRLK
jgi:hypothetical protein